MTTCPHCDCTVIGEVATHVAFTQRCQADQIADILWGDVQPLNTQEPQ